MKRGGRSHVLRLDFNSVRSVFEPASAQTAERLFEQEWALTLLQEVFQRLERENNTPKRAEQFRALHPFLTGNTHDACYQDTAELLGLTLPATRMAVSRLRRRYRELLRSVIAETVSIPDEVDDELRHLMTVFQSK